MDADIQFDDGPWLMEGEAMQPDGVPALQPGPGVPAWQPDWNPDAPHLDWVQALTVGAAARVIGLPVRHLQHQRLSDLYWVFQGCWERLASCLPEEQQLRMATAPSYRTFRRHWRRWSEVLKIKKSSQHAQCQTCAELLQQLHRRGASWAERATAAAALRRHYQDQYLDRCLYWSLRFAARAGQDAGS